MRRDYGRAVQQALSSSLFYVTLLGERNSYPPQPIEPMHVHVRHASVSTGVFRISVHCVRTPELPMRAICGGRFL